MKHIGINAKVASHVFSLLAAVEGTTVCLEIPLQSPPPPRETVTWRPSPPPHPGDRRALTREFARGAGGTRRIALSYHHLGDFYTPSGALWAVHNLRARAPSPKHQGIAVLHKWFRARAKDVHTLLQEPPPNGSGPARLRAQV